MEITVDFTRKQNFLDDALNGSHTPPGALEERDKLTQILTSIEAAAEELELLADDEELETELAAAEAANRQAPETDAPDAEAPEPHAERPAPIVAVSQRPLNISPPVRSATTFERPALRIVESAQAKPVAPAQAKPIAPARVEPMEPIAAAIAEVLREPELVPPASLPPEPAPPPAETAESRQDNFPTAPAQPKIGPIIDADRGPLNSPAKTSSGGGGSGTPTPPSGGGGGGKGSGGTGTFHRRTETPNFSQAFQNGVSAVRRNLTIVMAFTLVINVLVLAIPIYLFQISDRVLTSRSLDTLVMLTIVVVGCVLLQAVLDAVRRGILMRTAVEVEVQLGAPILSAAARASLNGNGREYQVLGDLQQLRSFITSGTLLSFFDAPLAPIFVLAVFMIHPQLGYIVVAASLLLLVVATINQRVTHKPFAESNLHLSRANMHLDSMTRNAQIINALAMIPEAVRMWGRDTAQSLKSQVVAQDRNITMSACSKLVRLLTQITMLGWGAYLSIEGQMTGGMVIAASIIAARALTPIEGAIEGWHHVTQFRASFQRIRSLLQSSPLNFERLLLPNPTGRLDVERLLFVPPTKKVILNGITFSLQPGESLAVIGNSGAGKTTLGKMLVGSILPTSGSVRLDLMDLRNWDQRQFGESIGYLPQDVQLFPGTIKANIARMRDDVPDTEIFDAAVLADVHELIASFPQGYETFVAADGAPLSGGQKQRIALARAFFGSPKLVVLDEPNSNLDSNGEQALARAIIRAKEQNITVVTITQRPALLNCVDKIMVLNNGMVSLFGTRTEVMKALAQAGTNPTQGSAKLPEGA